MGSSLALSKAPKLTAEVRAERRRIYEHLLWMGDVAHERSRLSAREPGMSEASRVRLADYYFAKSEAFLVAAEVVRSGAYRKRRATPKRSKT